MLLKLYRKLRRKNLVFNFYSGTAGISNLTNEMNIISWIYFEWPKSIKLIIFKHNMWNYEPTQLNEER